MSQEVDRQTFRQVMGHFATGITVITALDQAGRNCGITANSFTSVSLDPPLVLVCVDRSIEFFKVITEAGHFNVNFLSHAQAELSRRFATKNIDKFDGVEHRKGVMGAPLLLETLGHLECSRYDLLPGGDHIIVVGKVEHLALTGGEPLLYFSSSYRMLQPPS
jgi:flavin reductase (DIM6/NTAB) family NADH-FMN oxidoreductase RutF